MPDLGSTVYLHHVPDWAAAELPELYQSCYAVLDYFLVCAHTNDMSACVLEEPRHVVVFAVDGSTVVVMNQLFEIDPESAIRVARSIFRAAPRVKRIRLTESRLDLDTLPMPTRVLGAASNMVLVLPSDVDKYLAGLSRGTRQKLRGYARRLEKAFPTHRFRILGPSEIDASFVHRIVEMNRQRMASKGWVSSYRDEDEIFLMERARRHGFATTITIDGRMVAGTLGSRAGNQIYLHLQAFDNDYADYHLGLVTLYLTVSACIEGGVRKLHLLWGKSDYKLRLGCVEEGVQDGCVYRSPLWCNLSLQDAWRRARWRWRAGRAPAMLASLPRQLRKLRA